MISSSATMSKGGKYRYTLDRMWARGGYTILWVMLNPSTADGTKDDATIRRCINFSSAWGFSGLTVVNLYAYRATKPADLWNAATRGVDIVGSRNNGFINLAAAHSYRIVLAWGSQAPWPRALDVVNMLDGRKTYCLDTTVTGQPAHPLRLAKTAKLKRWKPPVRDAA